MVRIVLPGIPAPSDRDARGRAAALGELSEGERTALLTDWILGFREGLEDALSPWSDWSAVPLGELLASPLGLRACALGLQRGVGATHHELRRSLPWREELRPPEAVEEEDADVWVGGVLRAPKYGAFLQDGPLLTFDSNHQSRWTPHEFLHRACGFFHRADMSRWECYLGARLAEALPVVHWYGFDLVARLDETRFERSEAAARPAARLEDARWLREPADSLRRRIELTGGHLQGGLAHAAIEFEAVSQERRTGRQVRIPHAFLNASSDATAYVVGHAERLSDREVSQVLEGVARPGEERWDSVASYQEHVESVMDRLLFEDIVLDLETARGPRSGRILWDALLRAAIGEGDRLEGSRREALQSLARRGLAGADLDWESALAELGEELDPDVIALGLASTGEFEAAAPEQVVDGLESVAPATLAWLQAHDETGETIQRFLTVDLWERAPLLRRMEGAMEASGDPTGAGVARIEALLAGSTGDDAVERLSEEASDGSHLVASRGFTALEGDWDALVHHAAIFGGGDLGEASPLPGLLVGRWLGEGALLPVPRAVLVGWRNLRDTPSTVRVFLESLERALEADPVPDGWPEEAEEWLGELLEAGAVGCFPTLGVSP